MEHKDAILKLCRLTYMLANELVESVEQKEKYFKLIDEIIEKNDEN